MIARHLLEYGLDYSTATRHSGHGLVELPAKSRETARQISECFSNRGLHGEKIADVLFEYTIGYCRPEWQMVVACASRGLRTGLMDAFRNVFQLQEPVYLDPIWLVLSASPWLCVRMVWLSRAGKQKGQFNIVAICQPSGGDATCSTGHYHACVHGPHHHRPTHR